MRDDDRPFPSTGRQLLRLADPSLAILPKNENNIGTAKKAVAKGRSSARSAAQLATCQPARAGRLQSRCSIQVLTGTDMPQGMRAVQKQASSFRRYCGQGAAHSGLPHG